MLDERDHIRKYALLDSVIRADFTERTQEAYVRQCAPISFLALRAADFAQLA